MGHEHVFDGRKTFTLMSFEKCLTNASSNSNNHLQHDYEHKLTIERKLMNSTFVSRFNCTYYYLEGKRNHLVVKKITYIVHF